jgi:hypothetical protein
VEGYGQAQSFTHRCSALRWSGSEGRPAYPLDTGSQQGFGIDEKVAQGGFYTLLNSMNTNHAAHVASSKDDANIPNTGAEPLLDDFTK